MMWQLYLREHYRGVFDGMLLAWTLNAHLEEIERQANELMERLTEQTAKVEGVAKQHKAEDQMEWIRRMSSNLKKKNSRAH